ncbi:hypothetical protein EUGRSUZ_E03341 [Eucalyptus grandis]|uniref:Uncharacterized protein n=1 Tax=Eucalyptus grandis TaxID=71139 RepID=A0ACC3KZP0_EUCGR|nr:hypothetical protein EUGRSUZ_E03341 [Eucalyptus grandis]
MYILKEATEHPSKLCLTPKHRERKMSSAQSQVKPCHEEEEEDPCLKALLYSSSQVFPRILHAAVELDLFGIIARAGPGAYMSPPEVAAHLPARTPESAEIIDRVLRCLASHSLLACKSETLDGGRTVERRYAISPAGKYYVRDEDGTSVGSLSLFAFHQATIDVWLQFKEAILGGGGNLFQKGTCHNWSDESCIKLLKNCYKALPANGKVIVMDFIMPDEPEDTMASRYVSLLDNAMLIQPGGKERTEKQFEYLCREAGFTGFKVAARAVSALGVIEFTK